MVFDIEVLGPDEELDDDHLAMLRWEAITACNAVWQAVGATKEERSNKGRVLATILGVEVEDDA